MPRVSVLPDSGRTETKAKLANHNFIAPLVLLHLMQSTLSPFPEVHLPACRPAELPTCDPLSCRPADLWRPPDQPTCRLADMPTCTSRPCKMPVKITMSAVRAGHAGARARRGGAGARAGERAGKAGARARARAGGRRGERGRDASAGSTPNQSLSDCKPTNSPIDMVLGRRRQTVPVAP